MESSATDLEQQLKKRAAAAMAKAYAPFSRTPVGAAVLTAQGEVHTGSNIENASYGLTMCAERVAVFNAVASEGPAVRIVALAIASEAERVTTPCGACRQVLAQFADGDCIVSFSDGETSTLDVLLPRRFTLPITSSEE